VTITNGIGQVVGGTNVTVSVATNAVGQAGVVSAPTVANVNNVWGTDASGNPSWTTGNTIFWKLDGNSNTNPPTTFIGTTDAKDFVIKTSNTERLRVNSAGNVRVGTTNYPNQCGGTSSTENLNVKFAVMGGFSSFGNYNNDAAVNAAAPSTTWANGVGSLSLGMNRSAGTSDVDLWNNTDPGNGVAATGASNRGFDFRNFQYASSACNSNLLANLNGQGDFTLTRYSGTGGRFYGYAFNNISDQRIKSDIHPIGSVLNKLSQLKPVSYFFKEIKYEPSTSLEISNIISGNKEVGFLAQEVYQLFPEIVSKPTDESKNLWALDYSKFSVVLVKAIQEQQQQIEQQQKEIQLLKEQLRQIHNN
jgi:hypothetical protein